MPTLINAGKIVSGTYKIPKGDWFKYLTSPHMTTEIMMYTILSCFLWNNTSWRFIYLLVITNQVT